MGGWVTIGISALAAYSFFRIANTPLMILSIINGVLCFWSVGVMHNYASYAMRSKADILQENMKAEGRLDQEAIARLDALRTKINPDAVPDWITYVNMATFVVAVGLLITFFVVKN
jgi:hypothetical protein